MQRFAKTPQVPEYHIIADKLLAEIREGLYSEDGRMPSEQVLGRRFRANRYTIRQSLDLLVLTGVLRPHQGKGYFLCEKPLDIQYTITPAMRFSDVIRRLGRRPEAKLLSRDRLAAPRDIADALGLTEGDPVYRLQILRLADDVPLSWNETWLPGLYFPELLDTVERMTSLYALLEQHYDMRLYRMQSTFRSGNPTLAEASMLQISPNTSILHIESVMRDQHGRRVELTSAKYRGDLCKVSIQFEA
ncbi:phosphonate metabolism transcriptional regulator PhnF [Paenibacillus sp. MWE-103]|uniref:Phosphonate metabolism transcriptional regulator PhnF n=1 Tax=Paenibacillus artemisiicola TaxID=1172618 RepID=A0ABS3WC28_9BACL|nr:phosphonate metabolism transcriptional regulator PhnF [Paenibacillus artemisiicola]MBO7745879.1 phosphonate metabolism transcriptional regulator PhnF [Paenibacillus artemisiicola]